MGITSRDQMIEIEKIQKGCQQIVDAAKEFSAQANSLDMIASNCNAEVLSADGKTVDNDIIDIGNKMKEYEGIASNIAGVISQEAYAIYGQQQRQLEEYLASLEKNN